MSNARKLADNLPSEGQLGNRNILINGAHQVSQRHGTSSVTVAPSDHFVVDRFNLQDYSDATFSSQQVTDAPEAFQYSSKITVTGTDTSLGTTQYQRFMQPIEGFNVSHLNYGWSFAQTTTLSFHVKSSLTGTFYVFVFNSAANRSFVSAYTINTANTWEKKSISIAGDQGGTWLKDTGVGMYLGWSLGTGTNFKTSTLDAWQGAFDMAGSNQVNLGGTNGATWQITGCQLEVGLQSTPFEHEPMPFTLSKCQRYYFQETTTGADSSGRIGVSSGAATVVFDHALPVRMRANPSVSLTSTNLRIGDMVAAGFTTTSGTVSLSGYTGSATVVYVLGGFSGLTSYRSYLHEPDASHPGTVKFSAEL
jgi:hypothetical protein